MMNSPTNQINMKFIIEHEYQKYLEMVGLEEMKMKPVQRMETRRAFIAGYGMCFRKIEDISQFEDCTFKNYMNEIERQVDDFFSNQAITKTS